MDEPGTMSLSELSTWSALCKDCRNRNVAEGNVAKRGGDARRQEEFEYSEDHARRQHERGQSRSDRCPECRRRHRKEISAFPVAYIDITAIGEAADSADDPERGPTGPLGGLGPLPRVHRKRTEQVDLQQFELGLTDAHLLSLLELMAENQVVILQAGTGTGKSTLVPFRLMNPPEGARFRPLDSGPIVITEPRVRATRDVAAFVGEAMCFGHDPKTCRRHIGPGYPVGFQCEGQKVWDEACNLIYATDGTVINWLVNGDLARFSVIVVDEAHERSGNIDNILTILAAQLPRYPHLRVIIASATIDQGYFSSYFSMVPTVSVAAFQVDAPKTIGYGVPLFDDLAIDEGVLADGMHFGDEDSGFALPGWPDGPNAEEAGGSLRAITRDKLVGLRRKAPNWPQQVEQTAADLALDLLRDTDEGGILIFLPTFNSIQAARAEINARLEGEDWGESVDVYWLMRATPHDEQDRAVGAVPPGRRKVVIASNIAETSLTIIDLRYVIDAGLVQQSRWDPDFAVSYGSCVPHSQSGVRQRWGRVGRKTHGWVFPLYSHEQFQAMPRDTPAGSTQMNLESTILKLFAAGEDPRKVAFPADFVSDDVSRDAQGQEVAAGFTRERERALAALGASGALNVERDGLSRMGSELARSRLPAAEATALMFADRLACVPEVATAIVALSKAFAEMGGIFASDRQWPDEWAVHARRCHEAFAEGCEDDLELIVRVFAEWRAQKDPERWAEQWWIDLGALKAIRKDAGKLIESLAPGMSHEADRPLDPRLLERARAAISRALPSYRYVRRYSEGARPVWDATLPGQSAVAVHELHLVPPPDDVIALGRRRPPSRGWVSPVGQAFGLVAVRVWAIEAAPDELDLIARAIAEARPVPTDHLQVVRQQFPVGALLRFDDWSLMSTLAVEKISDGMRRPRPAPVLVPRVENARSGATVVFSTSTVTSESESEPGAGATADETGQDDPAVAFEASAEDAIEGDLGFDSEDESAPAFEIPEEELRLLPVPIQELENPDAETFDHAESEVEDLESPRPLVAFAIEGGLLAPGVIALARVIGYDRTDEGVTVRVIAVPEKDRQLEPGESLRVAVAMRSRTHQEVGSLLRRLDVDGNVEGEEMAYFDSLLDGAVAPDAEALPLGAEFDAVAVPGKRRGEGVGPNLVSMAYSELLGGRNPNSLIQAEAKLTTRTHRNWRGEDSVLARIQLPGGARPGILVPRSKIVDAGIAIEDGARIKLGVGFDLRARKTGSWREDDIAVLVDRFPDLFSTGNGRKLRFESRKPLSDAHRDQLIAFGEGDVSAEANAWLLWQTSRRFRVLSVQSLADAEVPPVLRGKLTDVMLTRFRKEFQVGIVRTDRGAKLRLSGSTDAVEKAFAAINDGLSETRTGFQIPQTGDHPPSMRDITAVLAEADPSLDPARIGSWVNGWKVWLARWYRDTGLVEAALRRRFDGTTRVLTFDEERGFFAFQKKERWEQISLGLAVSRSVATAKSQWTIRASNAATLDDLVGRFRAVASAVPFTEEPDRHAEVTRIERTTEVSVRVDYTTPRQSMAMRAPFFVVIEDGPRLLVEEPVPNSFVARDPYDGAAWSSLGGDGGRLYFDDFQFLRPEGEAPVSLIVQRANTSLRAVAIPLDAAPRSSVKVVGSGHSFVLNTDTEGATVERDALEAANPAAESWAANIERRHDRVSISVGDYAADLAPVAGRPHEFRGTERHGGSSRVADVWWWG